MADSDLKEIKNILSEIERAIKDKNLNEAITKYNILRNYANSTLIDTQTRNLLQTEA